MRKVSGHLGFKARRASRTNGRKLGGVLALLLCAAFPAGCGSPVKQTFDLGASAAFRGQNYKAPRRAVQISVSNPGALKALDSQNIVIRGADGSVAYLKGAQWSDHLTDMVQMQLIQGLEDSGHFAGVGRPRDGLNANYQLITDLRIFGVDNDVQGKFANVEIVAKIMDDKTGTMRKMQVFSAKRRVNGKANGDYALALDSAFAAVLQDIVRWTARSL